MYKEEYITFKKEQLKKALSEKKIYKVNNIIDQVKIFLILFIKYFYPNDFYIISVYVTIFFLFSKIRSNNVNS